MRASRKKGTLLIKLELARHGLVLAPEQAAALRETEFARAQALWQRKFGELAPDARLRAKQARFLAARGFAADVVRRVVGGEEEFDDDVRRRERRARIVRSRTPPQRAGRPRRAPAWCGAP